MYSTYFLMLNSNLLLKFHFIHLLTQDNLKLEERYCSETKASHLVNFNTETYHPVIGGK